MSEPTYKSAKLVMQLAMSNPPKPIGFDVQIDGKTVAVLTLHEFAQAMVKFADADGTYRKHLHRLTAVPESNTPRADLEKRVNAMLDRELPK